MNSQEVGLVLIQPLMGAKCPRVILGQLCHLSTLCPRMGMGEGKTVSQLIAV